MKNNQTKTKRKLVRVGKHLNEIVSIRDTAGNLLHKAISPVMVEVYPRDIIQQIVGASLIAVPIAFSEEVWGIGNLIPWWKLYLIILTSLIFMAIFVYHNFYRNHFQKHKIEFIKRLVSTYIISLLVSLLVLFLLDKAPLLSDWTITIKRMIILSFPASMSAAIADVIK